MAVEATADIPLLLALAYSARSVPCSSRGRCFCARRETARDKMKRLALTENGAITYYERGVARRQDTGSPGAQFLPIAALQVRKGATGGNRRPWNFPKISLRWGAGASAGSRTLVTEVILHCDVILFTSHLISDKVPSDSIKGDTCFKI